MISLQFLLTALVVVCAPGTGVVYTLAIALGQGRRAALWAAFGCTVGIVPHLLAAPSGRTAQGWRSNGPEVLWPTQRASPICRPMETSIPRAALILGLAGLIPFVWGALSVVLPDLGIWAAREIGPRFAGPYVQLAYGTVNLSFMSGVLWGFATRATGRVAATGYALSVLPALWAFVFVGGGPVSAAIYLIAGFVGLLGLDWLFWRQGLAPPWWMQFRVLLSVVIVGCLSVGVL